VTIAITTLRIRLIDKPPLLLLRLATRCRAPLALAILFLKCVLKDSFGLSQKLSYLVVPYLIAKDCVFCSPENLTAPAKHENLGLTDFELNFVV
jgi:hypothetical protein